MPTTRRFPKIELHVHLEGTVRPKDLLRIAARNHFELPADNERDLEALYQYRDFEHFLELWLLTTAALQRYEDFKEIVVAYGHEASDHGAVYIEGIFTPAERIEGGASWDEVFAGFCDGAEAAREETGVIVRLTPDIPRLYGLDAALETARYAIKYGDRGVCGIGIGGPEAGFPPEPFEPAFRLAKDGGIGSVPHAGEAAGPASIRGALDALGADRIRHGIRAVDDPGLLDELAERSIVCDVCPVSNLRTGVVASMDEHPLPTLLASGVLCSVSTDDPAMFNTDLTRDYEVSERMGCTPQQAFRAGATGALCDESVRSWLWATYESCPWVEGERRSP